MTVITKSPEQTELLGKKLAELLRPGDVIAYYGDLGAGKTAFTRTCGGAWHSGSRDEPDVHDCK